ncbi:MAG: hypothetical protein HYX47_12885 [Burkholderiales bacterium]|nr:hypothetical protein [Burkholderiales bacterium]
MSSTYISGYRAVAFRTLAGFAYCLFNETAESNLHPRTPHWSAHLLGSLGDLGGRLVQHAYCCDDGSVRGPHGREIRAEHYIKRSEDAIRAAALIEYPVALCFGKYLHDIPSELCEVFDGMAAQLGVHPACSTSGAEANGRQVRELDLRDPAHGELIARFAAAHRGKAYPWRIFPHTPSPCGVLGEWNVPDLQADLQRIEGNAARSYLSMFRLVELACPYDGQSYIDAKTAVIDQAGRICSTSPLQWFCAGYLKERNAATFGASAVCLREYRKWEKEDREKVAFQELAIEASLLDGQSDYARRCATELAGGDPSAKVFGVAQPQAAWQYLHMAGQQLDFRVQKMARAANAAVTTTSLF